MAHLDDLRIKAICPLPTPRQLIDQMPYSEASALTVQNGRQAAANIIAGKDDRLLVEVGPCSIHDPQAALDYARRLRAEKEKHSANLEILMRIYFAKPRTTVGWKGLINDPDLDGGFKIEKGLAVARTLLIDVTSLGLPVGSEMLDVIAPQYVSDLISWGAIGARTTESQVHRELASGASYPMGFKNGTDGSVRIAVSAVKAAATSHHFLAITKDGLSAIAETTGNSDCHIILRGGVEPNYNAECVSRAIVELREAGLMPAVMIDASHANSGYDPKNQTPVVNDVAGQVASGNLSIKGVMIESNLAEGRQDCVDPAKLIYGQSITDGCIGWEATVDALDVLACAVAQRRSFVSRSAA